MENRFMQALKFIQTNMIETRAFSVLIWILVILGISKIIKSIILRSASEDQNYYALRKKINFVTSAVIIFVVIYGVMSSATNITTYIGLLSAGIAIALKEIFINIAGWTFISVKKPFDVGHRISIENQKGDVIDRRLFHFSIIEVSSYEEGEQSTGRIIDIPNSFIFSFPIINYTKGFEYIWNEIPILVSFDSDWKKAKKLFLEIAVRDTETLVEEVNEQLRTASRHYMIQYGKLTPIVYTEVKEGGIQLTIRYLCEPKRRRTTTNQIWEDILDAMDEHPDIHLSYVNKA